MRSSGIFEKWDLHAARIGEVTDDGLLRVKDRETVVAEIPAAALADEAPLYDRPTRVPSYLRDAQQLDPSALRPPTNPEPPLLALLASPAIASKRWVYRQYDHMVRTNSILLAGMGAGVVRVKGTRRALAFSVDGNGRYCYQDPHRGAMLAVAEAARNVACAGAAPIGATNCLNFGSPERPEIMWQLVHAVRGIAEACRALDIPVTGGNVSLYNETDSRAIYPTPVLGVVGLIEKRRPHARTEIPGRRLGDRAAGRHRQGRAWRKRVPEGGSRPRGRPAAGVGPRPRASAPDAPRRGRRRRVDPIGSRLFGRVGWQWPWPSAASRAGG